ncbi:MAG TPA: hypothetical protein VFF27_18675 [Bacteroidia bacterium]|nr:hypothetical protein [Bacteroidia bacterium]
MVGQIKDTSMFLPIVATGYGYYLPGENMVERFGNNSSVYLSAEFKMENNWMFGINGSYLFGKIVKDKPFYNITKDNVFINSEGDEGDVRLYERGFTVSGTFGRMFVLSKARPNCGLVANLGLGFIQHKIRIEVIGNNIPQLDKNYKKGYDRLTNGLLLSQNLGYVFLSKNRLVNFYVGLECMEGFTQNRREFDFDKMQRDTKKRVDVLTGLKVAWILPLYKKGVKVDNYYIY